MAAPATVSVARLRYPLVSAGKEEGSQFDASQETCRFVATGRVGPFVQETSLVGPPFASARSAGRFAPVQGTTGLSAPTPESHSQNHLAGGVSLRVEALTFAPKGEAPRLRDVTFTLPAGAKLAVLGENGAGKTTLLRLLYRFYKPTSGTICLGGFPASDFSRSDYARLLAAVLQESPADFGLSVRQVVALGRTPHRKTVRTSRSLARLAHRASSQSCESVVDDVLHRLNLDALAERPIATLSGGQRQRVMIARALAQEPRLLVLDEPTSNLDARQRLAAIEAVASLGISLVFSIHDIDIALTYADYILVLSEGRMLGLCPADPQSLQPLISEAFGAPARIEVLQPSQKACLVLDLHNSFRDRD